MATAVVRVPAGQVPNGAVILGASGRKYWAARRTGGLFELAYNMRPVLDYGANLRLVSEEQEVVCLWPDESDHEDLSLADPEHVWLNCAWQYDVN